MAIFHLSVKRITRRGGRSAIASAAYRAGDRLRDDEIGKIYDFTKKHGVVFNEILLCENAPPEYVDRETLWAAVQKVEKSSVSRMAQEVEVALPVEMTREQQIECVRHYIQENFVSQGMCADWALHDKDDGNPHAHIMLTVRPIDEHHQWAQKRRSVYANSRDAQGRAIYDPELPSYDPHEEKGEDGHRASEKYRIPVLDENGKQKARVRDGKGKEMLWERVNAFLYDWDKRERVEEWRASWARECNKYLDRDHQIDHRSYERQGADIIPTIHEGYAARAMERKGQASDRVRENKEIKKENAVLRWLKTQVRAISERLDNLVKEKAKAIGKAVNRDFDRNEGNDRRYNPVPGRADGVDRADAGHNREADSRDRGTAGGKRGAEIDVTIDLTAEKTERRKLRERIKAAKERFERTVGRGRGVTGDSRRAECLDRESPGADREANPGDRSLDRRERGVEERDREAYQDRGEVESPDIRDVEGLDIDDDWER